MKRKKVALVITIAVCAIMCGSNTVTFASGYTEENQDDYSYDEYADSDESDDEADIPQNSEDVVDDVTFFSDIHKEKKLKKILKKYLDIQKKAEKEIDFDNLWYVNDVNIITASGSYKITNDDDFDYYYTGPLKKNKPDGTGIVWYSFEDSEYLEDGERKYVGELKKGKADGIGLELGINDMLYGGIADYYLGEFKNGEESGFGLEVSDAYSTCGEFKKGYPYGKVTEYYYDTLIYEGNMKKGEYSGKGKTYYLDGTVEYEGEFKNGKYHGKGTLYDEDGNKVYSGRWKNGDYA